MRTSNGIERPIQQELKRRTSKVRVFPNLASLERLSTAVLIDEKWETETKAYIKWEQLDQLHDNFQTSGCVILAVSIVTSGTRQGKLWNEFVARYHCLGHTTLVGARMRHAIHDRNRAPVAMLGFSTAAWKIAPRDTFIGWIPEQRQKNLPLVVDNPRFLIMSWLSVANLGSHILAIMRRRLSDDWTRRYNTTPVLIETFVQTLRYTGTVYKASGWIHVGTTKERGRYDTHEKYDKPKKDIWLRPLRKDWKRILNR